MSEEYKEFLKEKEIVEKYLEKGLKIEKIYENLDGTVVKFSNSDEEIILTTPNARKLIVTKLIHA
ncbi:hypothetical protein [Ureibacillus sp. FSL K6-0786]|uniref:hypothetical protein n=1 Tax=Ureibacillus sp. FSL K6-0786 TaxID=2954607 RepID=UPI0030D942E1